MQEILLLITRTGLQNRCTHQKSQLKCHIIQNEISVSIIPPSWPMSHAVAELAGLIFVYHIVIEPILYIHSGSHSSKRRSMFLLFRSNILAF